MAAFDAKSELANSLGLRCAELWREAALMWLRMPKFVVLPTLQTLAKDSTCFCDHLFFVFWDISCWCYSVSSEYVHKKKFYVVFAGAHAHVDVLSCEIECQSLEQVQHVWGALSKRLNSEEEPCRIAALWDGFAQEEERRCSKIVVSIDGGLSFKPVIYILIVVVDSHVDPESSFDVSFWRVQKKWEHQGYLATVVLRVTSLTTLENNLNVLSYVADRFGLLNDAKPQRWLQTVDGAKGPTPAEYRHVTWKLAFTTVLALARFIAMLTAAYFVCQYLVRYGPSYLREQTPAWLRNPLALGDQTHQSIEEGEWWHAVYLSAPYGVLILVFAHDLVWNRSSKNQKQLSRIWYDRHFGIEGSHYVLKTAVLQLLTVLLQAFGKLHLLGGIALFAEQQGVAAATLKAVFWLFWVLLLCNSLYPSVLLIFPESLRFRYIAATMDFWFDLGYVLTYLVMVVLGMMQLHVSLSVWGNFGDRSQMGFSNSTLPPSLGVEENWLCFAAQYFIPWTIFILLYNCATSFFW